MATVKKQPIKTTDEYLDSLPADVRIKLEKMRQTIKKAAPEAEEFFSYQMPAYRFHGVLAWFAAFKNHYSLFVRPVILSAFTDETKSYETTKSALRIPIDKPVPVQLIKKIIQYAAKENQLKASLKNSKR